MLEAIKRELRKYEGMWFLPDDLDDLMEIIAAGLAASGIGPQWIKAEEK